jgi:acetate kinase
VKRPLLIINAGSSSIKFALYHAAAGGALEAGASGQIEGIGTDPHMAVRDAAGTSLLDVALPAGDMAHHPHAIAEIDAWLRSNLQGQALAAVGHRVVHGGERYAEPVLIDAAVLAALDRLVPLAPLHQPHNLAAVRAVAAANPDLPQVACFDTAFHRSQPAVAQAFAVPRELFEQGVRRYGFHGLSYEYVSGMLGDLAPELAAGRVVVAHLGNGASMCAINRGKSVATTMGFTPLDGLPMGTRCGAIDPGVLLYLMDQHKMDTKALEKLLYYQSGLLGVSGLSSDMRTLLASDDKRAREAIDLFCYRIGRELGSLAAALGGLDGLVFTGGIGEHAAEIRTRVCREAGWLGIALDEEANRAHGPRISRTGGAVSAWVVQTDENLMIARHTLRLVADRRAMSR